MARLSKYFKLSSTEQRVLLAALLLLGAIRLGLWLLPFRILRRLLDGMTRRLAAPRAPGHTSVDTIIWAVTVASHYIPRATCLTQGLGAQALLRGQGHAAVLHIGVARSAAGQFQAHAWVEHQGRVVLGGTDAPLHFTPLRRLEGQNW